MSRILSIALAVTVLLQQCADAQAPPKTAKGFDLVKKKAPPLPAPVVIGAPKKAHIVKVWNLGTEEVCPRFPKCVAGVEEVKLLSNGHTVWKFFLKNRGSDAIGILVDMNATYIASPDGETYEPLAPALRNNTESGYAFTLRPGTKTAFFLEYATKEPITSFKVGLLPDVVPGGMGGRKVFETFTVELEDPNAPESEEAAPQEGTPVPGDAPARVETVPGKPGRRTPQRTSAKPQTLHTVSQEGRRYEGAWKTEEGGKHTDGGIVFDKPVQGELLTARLFTKKGPSKEIKLKGAIVEDLAAPGGAVFRFEDKDDRSYKFTLDGTVLSGTDSAGNHYTFMQKK